MNTDDGPSKTSERARILSKDDSENQSCLGLCRRSPTTAVALSFILMFLDAMLLTALEPILADIVRNLDDVPEFLQDEDFHKMKNQTSGVSVFASPKTGSLAVGIVFSAKPFMELISNPLVGYIVDKYGYEVPMYAGFIISIVSALGFAFSNTYLLLLISRCLQGFGNVLLIISNMSFVSFMFGDTPERSAAFAIIYIGTGIGSLVGFPYGGVLYEYVGREYPYLILSIFILFAYCFKLWYKPEIKHKFQQQESFSGYLKMCRDPYIVMTIATWVNLSFVVSGILVIVPLLAYDKFDAGPFDIGIVFLCFGIIQAVTQGLLAKHTQKIGWWKLCFTGGLLFPCVLMLFMVMPSFWYFVIPVSVAGVAMALFLSSFHAMLCHITDIRVGPNYGAVFSFNKIGYSIGMFTGSMVFSLLIDSYGYNATLFITSGITFVVNFIILFLREVPNIMELELDDKAKK